MKLDRELAKPLQKQYVSWCSYFQECISIGFESNYYFHNCTATILDPFNKHLQTHERVAESAVRLYIQEGVGETVYRNSMPHVPRIWKWTENLPILQDFVPFGAVKQGKETADHLMPLGDWFRYFLAIS